MLIREYVAWTAGQYAREARHVRECPQKYVSNAVAWFAGYDDTDVLLREWTVEEYMLHFDCWGRRRKVLRDA